MKIKTAVISVSDKTGVVELAQFLAERGVQIYSTGGTAKLLKENGVGVFSLSDLTNDHEMIGGRVKSLHSKLYAGILANMDDSAQVEDLHRHNLSKIDLVVANFYPFSAVVAGEHQLSDAIENIDIGGPTMVRAAAKNFPHTWVLSAPTDYPLFIGSQDEKQESVLLKHRQYFAVKTFSRLAALDIAIANYFSALTAESEFSDNLFLHLKKATNLPYGENPHQQAACYSRAETHCGFTQLQGAPASYNNFLDTAMASHTVSQFSEPTVAIVKHNNPCGLASASTLADAYRAAKRCDPTSSYGGVVAFNGEVDEEVADLMANSFYEVVAAPQYTPEAKSLFALKNKLRLLIPFLGTDKYRLVEHSGLFLMQSVDSIDNLDNLDNLENLKSSDSLDEADNADDVDDNDNETYRLVTKKAPTDSEKQDLIFAWRAVACIKSNAVVLVKNKATIGIGAGQMSRVDSAWLACQKAANAKIKIQGAVAASDGFFPFADGLRTLAESGVRAVIQPGGSKNDAEVIKCADENGIAMVFTGRRHFLH